MDRRMQQDPLLGLARRIGLGRNSLRRPVDRFEAVTVVLAWLATMVIALGGVVFGLSVAQADLVTSTRQLAQLHATTGVMLESSVAATGSTRMRMPVPVRYLDQNGTTRTGRADESVGLASGTSAPVWLDGMGAIGALSAEVLLLAVFVFVRWRMDGKKFAAIDLEWTQLSAR
jgi:hypothetical protein